MIRYRSVPSWGESRWHRFGMWRWPGGFTLRWRGHLLLFGRIGRSQKDREQ
jgi:hypothetical protein